MKKDPVILVENRDDLVYEKDPRFIEYMKLRLEKANDPKNRIPYSVVREEIRLKYGF